MKRVQVIAVGALVLGVLGAGAVHSGEKKAPEITEKEFRRANFQLLEDPLAKNASDLAKAVVVFAMQTPKAEVMLGKKELKWFGGKEDKRGLLLFAAYVGGNTLAQLDSGVKRNEPYPGLLQLFRVYRALREKDRDYSNDDVQRLLKLHQDGRLIQHLMQEEKKSEKKEP
jgi:hypothetical protein